MLSYISLVWLLSLLCRIPQNYASMSFICSAVSWHMNIFQCKVITNSTDINTRVLASCCPVLPKNEINTSWGIHIFNIMQNTTIKNVLKENERKSVVISKLTQKFMSGCQCVENFSNDLESNSPNLHD